MNSFSKIRLKYVSDVYNGNSIPDDKKDYYYNKAIPYIPTKELKLANGEINYTNGLSVDESDGFKIAPKESVLLCIEGGSAGKKIGLTNQPVAFVNKLCCIHGTKIPSKLLYFCLKSKDFVDQFFLSMTGLIGGVTVSALKNIEITIPTDKSVQLKIADILSQKCCTIDKLIGNQEQQIEKLKQYKQSLISEVVTKGLNTNVEMKDSGIDWIGMIPKDWQICRIKNLFELRNERNFEQDLNKVNLISLYTDLGVVQHSELEETSGNHAITAEGYKVVYPNDIVVNIILCWMGAIGISNYKGVTSPAYDVYCPKKGVNSNYFHYLFRTKNFNGECFRYGRGIMLMRWRTYSAEFGSLKVPIPSSGEQEKIVEFLKEKNEKIDKLIKIKETKIKKLNEYKKSLIYEYVTGKKEVV